MEQKLLQEKEEKNSVGCSIMAQVQVQSEHGQYVCKLIPCVHDVIPFFFNVFQENCQKCGCQISAHLEPEIVQTVSKEYYL